MVTENKKFCSTVSTSRGCGLYHLIDTRISYSQLELDEVRMELADFFGGQM
ncbi:hypothetical protein IC582_016129 [Cucumis melo]